jgi:UDP-N-acetylglucosamine--N-acetylmuramyl-(pentapeptide) pyrophosphoryl-undecaprenol N-acetylglucosamine transferase
LEEAWGQNHLISSYQSIFKKINGKKKLSIIHQSGEKMFELLKESYEGADFKVETRKYIFDMEKKYNWADIVIARSGALTVSELITSGSASILIPYPFAVDDHQFFNAKILKDAGACRNYKRKRPRRKISI